MAKIRVRDNGPYVVESSPTTIVDAVGGRFELKEGSIALCRCGHSADKPFCDASHRRIEFAASERADSQ